MLELETRNVQLQGQMSGKKAAIREVGNLLVNSQYIKPGYIDSMLAREKVANTYLSSGVARSRPCSAGRRSTPPKIGPCSTWLSAIGPIAPSWLTVKT